MHAFVISLLRIILGTICGLFLLGTCIYFGSEPAKKKYVEPTEQETSGVKTFTTGGVSFDYPATWTAEKKTAPDGDTIVQLTPADRRATRVAMSLLVTRNAEAIAAPKPIVGKDMTVQESHHITIDDQPGWYVDYCGVTPDGSYSHGRSWQFTNPTLHIAFTGTVSSESEFPSGVDSEFYKLSHTIGDAARSLKFEPTRSPE